MDYTALSIATSCSKVPVEESIDDMFDRIKREDEESINFYPKPMTEEQFSLAFEELQLSFPEDNIIDKILSTKRCYNVKFLGKYDRTFNDMNNIYLLENVKHMIYNQAVIMRKGLELNKLKIPLFALFVDNKGSLKRITDYTVH